MTRILVTGGTGFVGAALVRRLLADGHDVHLLVRASHTAWRLSGIHDEVRLHVCDLADAASVDALVREVAPDAIAHLAVYGAYSDQVDLAQMLHTNVHGTANLVEAAAAAGVARFVNTGSSSEYGYRSSAPTEADALEPNSHYAVTKAAGTMFCRHAASRSDLFAPTLRLYSIYGPWEEPTRLLPRLVGHAVRGSLPPLVSPTIARDFVYVDDAVDAYARLLVGERPDIADPAPVYNVASGVQVTLAELVEVARSTFGVEAAPSWGTMSERSWDTDTWVGDSSRAATELGWSTSTPLADGLRGLADWVGSIEDELIAARYDVGHGAPA